MKINKKVVKSLAVIAGLSVIGIGATYASFSSNTVSLAGTSISTGEAAIKLCDNGGGNNWTTSINPNLNISNMIPNEERDMLGSRAVYIGNDSGVLATAVDSGVCTSYLDPASHATTPTRLNPNIVFTAETCPDPLPSNIKIRFDVKGTDTGYKTLTSWASNATTFDPTFAPGEVGQIKAFAQLSSTSVAQNSHCNFSINFTGKQPS